RIYSKILNILNIKKSKIHLEQDITLTSKKLAKTLKGCKQLVAFIGTIGPELEHQVKKMSSQNQLSTGYILDTMGSIAVENMVEHFHNAELEQYKRMLQGVTLRFSPGYCDWSIKEQEKIFRIFKSENVGIELMSSCLMSPRKSISGVFGILPKGSPPFSYNPCSECKRFECEARR
ncbi:MAG: hypothetical protein JRI54_04710, partial [Deltaproteobacteria bacterium]|nr:hypothetical protein [Deltaproteobacteria bacterium]